MREHCDFLGLDEIVQNGRGKAVSHRDLVREIGGRWSVARKAKAVGRWQQ
jgi:hypothetical protein